MSRALSVRVSCASLLSYRQVTFSNIPIIMITYTKYVFNVCVFIAF